MNQAYDENKTYIFYKIAEPFVAQGKNIKQELSVSPFNYVDMMGIMKAHIFKDFLKQHRFDLNDLRQDRLDIAFNHSDSKEIYNMKELIEYANMLVIKQDLSIFE